MRIFAALVMSIVIASVPTVAGETAWQEVAPGVQIRLISAGQPKADGKALFALEIDMPEDTKTYWRIPGETGLPMDLDFSSSKGVALHQQHWPFPEREQKGGYLDYVYFGHTILPLELAVSEPGGTVALEATLGICSEICVPAQAQFTMPASEPDPDYANGLRIAQAMADVPIAWQGAGDPLGSAMLVPGQSAIAVEIDPAVVDPQSLIAAAEGEGPLFGAPQKSPQSNLVLLPILSKTDNSALDDMEVELSFMTPRGAFEVSRTIEAGAKADVDGQD